MTPALCKLNLTAHITFSVSWIGAAAAFLVLSVAGLTSHDTEIVRGAYLSMNLVSRFVIIPLSFAAVATGLLQALGTQWGLFRYYWVVMKFALAVFATVALLMHQFSAMALAAKRVSGAATETLFNTALYSLKTELLRASGLGIVVLLMITFLSIYKPWGLTPYGLRKLQERRKIAQPLDSEIPSGVKVSLAVIGVLMLAFVVLHLTGHGFGHHGH